LFSAKRSQMLGLVADEAMKSPQHYSSGGRGSTMAYSSMLRSHRGGGNVTLGATPIGEEYMSEAQNFMVNSFADDSGAQGVAPAIMSSPLVVPDPADVPAGSPANVQVDIDPAFASALNQPGIIMLQTVPGAKKPPVEKTRSKRQKW
jgi:hypothetical protein